MSTQQFTVAANIGNLTHVIDQDSTSTKHIVIQAPCSITCATTALSSVLIATCDNKVWEVQASALRSAINKRTDESTSPEHWQKEQQIESEDIFGELLQHEGGTRKRNAISCSESEKLPHNVVHLKPDHLLLTKEYTILDIAAAADVFAILYAGDGLLELSVFQLVEPDIVKQSAHRGRAWPLHNISTSLEASLIKDTLTRKIRNLYFLQCESQTDISGPSTSAIQASSNLPSQVLSVPLILYTSLFGKEAACLRSPILLWCCGDSVFTHAVKFLKASSKGQLKVMCQMNSDIRGILSVPVRDEFIERGNVDQETIAALSAALGKEIPGKKQDNMMRGLLVLTVTGDGCLFISLPDSSEGPMILKFVLPHHITACTVFKDFIIYSSDHSVEMCRLTLGQRSEEKTVCVIPVMQTLLGKARFLELHPFSLTGGAKGSAITGVTYNLEMMPISVIWTEDNNTGSHGMTSSSSLDDILHNIEQCCQKIDSARKKSKEIDSFLQQINIFAGLVHSLDERIAPKRHKLKENFVTMFSQPGVTCHCSILVVPHLYSYKWTMGVKLKNSMGTILSEDWTIVVTLCCADCDFPVLDNPDFSKSYSFPLSRGLKPASELELCIPLDDVVSISPMPMLKVSIGLVLKLRTVHSMLADYTFLHKGLMVKVHKQQFDVLSFVYRVDEQSLRLQSGDKEGFRQGVVSDKATFNRELQKMAARRTGRQVLQEGEPSSLTTRIGVSKSVCEDLKLFSPMDVLLCILKDTSVPPTTLSNRSCQVQEPHGSMITITVSAVTAVTPDFAKTRSSAIVEHLFIITLRGTCGHFIHQTSAAIRSRLKLYSEVQSAQSGKSTMELQRHLSRLQKVKEEMTRVQEMLECQRLTEGESGKLLCEMMEKREMLPK